MSDNTCFTRHSRRQWSGWQLALLPKYYQFSICVKQKAEVILILTKQIFCIAGIWNECVTSKNDRILQKERRRGRGLLFCHYHFIVYGSCSKVTWVIILQPKLWFSLCLLARVSPVFQQLEASASILEDFLPFLRQIALSKMIFRQ